MFRPPLCFSRRRIPRTAPQVLRLLMLVCAVAGWCAVAGAQTYYKWSDERGVVHFSDAPPANVKNVEERNLPARPQPRPAEPAPQRPAGEAAAPGATPPVTEGPARVVLVSRQAPRTGPSAVHLSGEVKNVGGADAESVTIRISAVDAGQGNPCLDAQAAVSPSTLHPGESGKFETDVDSPCLFGETTVDVAPVWE